MRLSRRTLLTSSAAGAAIAVPSAGWAETRRHATVTSDPFTLGVASGDPTPDGVVLWTRLAVDPLAEDGMGGMPDASLDVKWEVSTSKRFNRRVASGTEEASPEWGHSVHIELDDLEPDTKYYYRFKTGRWVSATGTTRTAPAAGDMPESLTMAFASCAQYEHGFFNAYRRLAETKPDLVLHLGDYQYEYTKNTYVSPDGNVRDHEGPETTTLAGYRQRHAQYKADEDLQAAHAVAPWLVVFDDHEVDNNWADEVYEHPEIPQPDFLARREAAFRAYWENMPLRRSSLPSGIDMLAYRRIQWGQLANFHMLDTRQYRDDQACGDGAQTDCAEASDPERTITGQEQEDWLLDGLHESEQRWDVIGQQVFFSRRDSIAGDSERVSMDAWDGYQGSQERITQGMIDSGALNPVVLTGDVHRHWASEIKSDWDDPDSAGVGVELVCSSITSGGNGTDEVPSDHNDLKVNPHIKFRNSQRGFVTTLITPDQLDVDFQVVPRVTSVDSAVHIRRSYSVASGDRTLHETYDRPVDESSIQSDETYNPETADDLL
ncbi:alkaline phosphatase D family protein [Glycomyces buryatensis]|uniref:Alkaline phosphatase n=1 Tax=Glycomyces buryatensis TaxID=2570927 RepID=A0A4S8Q9Y4_9ACTN|nr:alkaline phosphatase D family protein [Glycomyces buryatensis]THV41148.1 alkaline phosphatase [Glycomyces buryatensis]